MTITITEEVLITESLIIPKNTMNATLTITGGGTLMRHKSMTGHLITVQSGASLKLENITIDGNKLNTAASGVLVLGISDSVLTMETNARLQNNKDSGVAINGNGTFNMNGGIITGNSTNYNGGGVNISGGIFNMTSGTISGNTANYGGGVLNSGMFKMTGGMISNNTANSGGGVHIAGGSTFNMNDGTISENTANEGGGVYAEHIFNMTGGLICGNAANVNGGGVFIRDNNTFTVGGTAKIKDNKKSDTLNNVYLLSNNSITLDTPDEGMEIWVQGEEDTVIINTGAQEGDQAYFKADTIGLEVVYEEGKLKLAPPPPPEARTLFFNHEDGKFYDFPTYQNEITVEGTSWNNEEKILTLNNFNWTTTAQAENKALDFMDDITLNLIGTNTISTLGADGIDCNGNINIIGDGTLNVTAREVAIYSNIGNINITDATVLVTTTGGGYISIGISTNHTLTITNATVTANAAAFTDGDSYGLFAGTSIAITGSNVTAANEGNGQSMFVNNKVNISVNNPYRWWYGNNTDGSGVIEGTYNNFDNNKYTSKYLRIEVPTSEYRTLYLNAENGLLYGMYKSYVFSDPISSLGGTSWDANTHTLTLNNVTWDTSALTAFEIVPNGYEGTVTLELAGNNSFQSTSDCGNNSTYAIKSASPLIITGDGTLNLMGGNAVNMLCSSYGIYSGSKSLTVKGNALLKAMGGTAGLMGSSYGISTNNLTLTNCNFTASGHTGALSGNVLNISGNYNWGYNTTPTDTSVIQGEANNYSYDNSYKYLKITSLPLTSVTNILENQEITYDGSTYDVTQLFTVDSGAGERTYTIETGSIDRGSIEGTTLTITKAGAIVIGLETAATATHAAGEKVLATLTVYKGVAPAAPTGFVPVGVTTIGGSDGKITGLMESKIYEYKLSNESNYTAVPENSTEITDLGAGRYVVRFAETDLYNAGEDSEEIEISQPAEPDTTPPTGEIKVKDNKFTSFLNSITFGLFFKKTQEVTITATDNSGETVTIEYFLAEEEKSIEDLEEETILWEPYSKFEIEPGKYVIYAKLTDSSDNDEIISTEGIVIYTDSKANTTSINFTKGSGENQTAKVTLNGNTISKIRNDITTLTPISDYTESDGTITFNASYLDTLVAGNYSLTIDYNPQGITYPSVPSEGSETPASTTILLIVIKAIPTAALFSDYTIPTNTVYDKTAKSLTVTANTGTIGLGTITVKYNGSTTPPINAGTYAITVDIAESTSWDAAEGIVIGNWTIAKPQITVTADAKEKIVGAADPVFTYLITSGNLISDDTLNGSLSREAGEESGKYEIKMGTLGNANYEISFIKNYLTIKEPTRYTVTGTVINKGTEGTVTVTIMQGNEIFGTSTGESFSFSNLIAGAYNIVARNGTESKTVFIKVNENIAVGSITIGTKSAEVEIKGDDTPTVVVDITALEKTLGDVTTSLKLVVDTTTAPEKIESMVTTAGQTIAFNLDFTIVKDGISQSTYEFEDIITAVFPIPDEAKGKPITIYRLHGDSASVMTNIPNDDGEYVEIDEDFITLHVKKFSDYSVAYTASTNTITANAGTGGTISPSGSVSVDNGDSITFTITPNSGYSISGVKVDGVSIGKVSTYTFDNVTANHTITVTFSYNGSSYSTTNAAAPTITTQPAALSAFLGETKKLNVAAKTTDSGTLSYQWYVNTSPDKTGGTAISVGTNAEYTVPTAQAGTYYYYVVVTNTNHNVNGSKTSSVTSNVVTVTVTNQFTVTYKINGGKKVSGMPSDTTKYERGNTVTVKGIPVSTSKFFAGWNTKANGTGKSYTKGKTFKITGNITLYAQWKDTITVTKSKLTYKVTGKNQVACIGIMDNKATTISIPNTVTYKGIIYKITSVAKNAFRGNEKITTVKIGNNVKTIYNTAFYKCPNLKKVTMGTGLETLGNDVFCFSKDGCVIMINSTKLKKVNTAINHGTKNMVIKVPKSKLDAYKKLFAKKSKAITIITK